MEPDGRPLEPSPIPVSYAPFRYGSDGQPGSTDGRAASRVWVDGDGEVSLEWTRDALAHHITGSCEIAASPRRRLPVRLGRSLARAACGETPRRGLEAARSAHGERPPEAHIPTQLLDRGTRHGERPRRRHGMAPSGDRFRVWGWGTAFALLPLIFSSLAGLLAGCTQPSGQTTKGEKQVLRLVTCDSPLLENRPPAPFSRRRPCLRLAVGLLGFSRRGLSPHQFRAHAGRTHSRQEEDFPSAPETICGLYPIQGVPPERRDGLPCHMEPPAHRQCRTES